MTSKHPTCSTCKHWGGVDEDDYVPLETGLCNRVPPEWETYTWDLDLQNVLKDEHKDTKAFANDGSSYHASLSTTHDFYCPMHSDLVGDGVSWKWGHPTEKENA